MSDETIARGDALISAGAMVFQGEKALILLNEEKGEWCFPKGRVNELETIEQAAKREVEEEAGVQCQLQEKVGVEVRYSDAIKKTKVIHWFKATFVSQSTQNLEEHENFAPRWVTIEEAKECLSFDEERRLFNACLV